MTQEQSKYGPGELPVEYTPIQWEDIVVGEEMGPLEFQIKESSHRKHCEHVQTSHPWFTEKSPWGGPILFPFEVYCGARVKSRWKYGRLNQGILAGFRWEFHKPVLLGERLTGQVKILDKYQKRGKNYYVSEGITRNEKGEPVFKSTDYLITLVDFKGKLRA